jgi:hypothetical protein
MLGVLKRGVVGGFRGSVCCVVAGVALVVLAGVPSAFAQGPWWHVTSQARPANLHSGLARDEVQEIKVNAVAKEEPLEPNNVVVIEQAALEEVLEGKKEFSELPKVQFAYNATHEEAQAALEGLYGARNVQVSGGPLGKPAVVTELEPYVVTFKGALANRSVGLMNTGRSHGLGGLEGTASVAVATAGRGDGEIVLTAENLGDGNANGARTPVQISDVLPAGLEAVGIAGSGPLEGAISSFLGLSCSLKPTLSCSFGGSLAPYDQLEVRIAVVVKAGAQTGEVNEGTVSGGEAQAAHVRHALTISDAPPGFGVENYELINEEEGGAASTQAGAHPFQQTTTLDINEGTDALWVENILHKPEVLSAALAKDLSFKWPPGLIGNPTVFPQCSLGQFLHIVGEINECPADTAVGVATVSIFVPGSLGYSVLNLPLFNLEPLRGEPARLGFYVTAGNAPVFIEPSLRSGGDYGITVSTFNIAQTVGFLSAQVSVWGVPGDPRHDNARGWGCLAVARGRTGEGACNALEQQHPPPFLSLPTACTGELLSTVEGDSWTHPGPLEELAHDKLQALDGCNGLPFGPEIKVSPDGQQASKPTGLAVDVHVPQEGTLNPTGLANSNIKSIKVKLPVGVSINPASADGLQACSESLIGFTGPHEFEPGTQSLTFTPKLPEPLQQGSNFCPDASKVATVKIKTPLLPNPLEGAVYLATPAPNGEEVNPFKSLIAMYIVAEDPISGSLVKLPGKVTLDQQTGQIESTFENTPQLAFEDAEVHFLGGERAPLTTPAHCGTYTTEAEYTPWSGTAPVKSSSSFEVLTGPNGTPCPGAALAFSPELTAGSVNNHAGSFSPFTMTMSRQDGEQNLKSIQLHMPPGLAGALTGVKLCGEAEANAGTCGPESEIGETTVSVGLGGDPFTVTGGKVYLTGPYQGASFGLSIVNPADAGPFHLGKVIVRAKLEIDPHTAAVTVTSDSTGKYAIPPSIDGIPLQIKHVNVTINRARFTFNPTSCKPLAITGILDSIEGATATVPVAFEAVNCATLKFAPDFKVSATGKTSKENGAGLTTKILYPPTPLGTQETAYANIAGVKVNLPKQLPSRLITLQKACPAAIFNTNPASCPPASIVGHARVITPLLPVPLTGPAYFVSHGGEAFPSLTMVLQGYGVTIDLIGQTFIKKGITSSTFRNTPDAPLTLFELTLPQGKYSALGANGNLCQTKLVMPTAFTAQNGITKHQTTKIAVTGCPKTKKPSNKHRKHK